jgi:hypothetical protein
MTNNSALFELTHVLTLHTPIAMPGIRFHISTSRHNIHIDGDNVGPVCTPYLCKLIIIGDILIYTSPEFGSLLLGVALFTNSSEYTLTFSFSTYL